MSQMPSWRHPDQGDESADFEARTRLVGALACSAAGWPRRSLAVVSPLGPSTGKACSRGSP